MRIVTFTSKTRVKKLVENTFHIVERERERSPARIHIPVWCFIAIWHNPVFSCPLMVFKVKKLTTIGTLEQGLARATTLVTIILITSTMHYKCILLLVLQIKLQ